MPLGSILSQLLSAEEGLREMTEESKRLYFSTFNGTLSRLLNWNPIFSFCIEPANHVAGTAPDTITSLTHPKGSESETV